MLKGNRGGFAFLVLVPLCPYGTCAPPLMYVSVVWLISQSASLFRESGTRPVSAIAISYESGSSDTLVGVGYLDGWVSVFALNSQKKEASFRAGAHRVTSVDISNTSVACAAVS